MADLLIIVPKNGTCTHYAWRLLRKEVDQLLVGQLFVLKRELRLSLVGGGKQLLRTAFSWAMLLAFMALFQPDKLPVVGLIIPFVLLFVSLYSLWGLFALVRARYFAKDAEPKPHKYLGAALCASAVLLLVLQSLGQLTVRDVITVLASVILGCLYLTRSRFTVPKQ